jgi:4-oxalocrotonate tautomerase
MQPHIREFSDPERLTALWRHKMALISCDMRHGRTDEQKRKLAAGLMRVISEATGEPKHNIFFVIREGRGINFVEHGEHLPDYTEGAAGDKELIARLT